MMNKIEQIESFLEELIPNPKCELDYTKDYEFLMAVVLSAQTTDKRVNMVTKVLFNKYKNLEELSGADIEDIAVILEPIGTHHKKAKFVKEIASVLLSKYRGLVPNDRNAIESFPGVGRKTANVVLSNLFDVPAIAVDTHVTRVSKRLGIAKKDDTVEIIEQKLMKKLKKKDWSKRHHQLVLFGRYFCKASNPNCNECKLIDICKYRK